MFVLVKFVESSIELHIWHRHKTVINFRSEIEEATKKQSIVKDFQLRSWLFGVNSVLQAWKLFGYTDFWFSGMETSGTFFTYITFLKPSRFLFLSDMMTPFIQPPQPRRTLCVKTWKGQLVKCEIWWEDRGVKLNDHSHKLKLHQRRPRTETRPETRQRQDQGGGHSIPAKAHLRQHWEPQQ